MAEDVRGQDILHGAAGAGGLRWSGIVAGGRGSGAARGELRVGGFCSSIFREGAYTEH